MGIVQRDGLKVTIVSYVGAAIGYINKIVLFPNIFKAEEVGLANIMVSIAVIFAQFSGLGIVSVILKFFPFFHDKENKHFGFLTIALATGTVGFILGTVLFFVFQNQITSYYAIKSPLLSTYYVFLLPLGLATLYNNILDVYLRSLLKTVVPSFVNEVLLRILLTLTISLFAFGLIDFEQFVYIYVGINCIAGLVILMYCIYLKQFHIEFAIHKISRRLGKIMMVYGSYSLTANVSNVIIANIDALMVAGMLGLGQTGIYTTLFFVSTIILIPYRSLLKVSSPIVASYWKEHNMKKMEEIYKSFSMVNLIIGILCFILIWVNIDLILNFMPQEYVAGKYVFLIISMAKLFDIASGLNGVILLTSRNYRFDLIFSIALVVGVVFCNYIFIPIWGMNGAAFACFITMATFNILRILFVQFKFGIQPFSFKFLYIIFLGFLSIYVSMVFPQFGHIYLMSITKTIISISIFIVPVLFFKISPDLNNYISKFIKR